MDDKNNENDFDDVDFEEFDDDFGEDDDLLGDNDIDSDPADLPHDDDDFAADDFDTDSMDDDDWGDEDSDDAPADPIAKGKKGSSSKLLLPVLLLVALGGGGAYYYTQILSKPQPLGGAQNQNNVADQTMNAPEPDMDIAIPMPSPITEPSQDEFQNEQPTQPTMSLADIESEYPGQDNSMNNEPSMQIEPAPANQDPNVLTPMPNIASMDEDVNTGADITNLDEPMANDDQMVMANDISEPTEMPIMDDNQPDMQITAPDMPEPAIMEDTIAPNNSVESPTPAVTASNQNEINEIQEKNSELSNQLSNMEDSVQQKDSQISALSKELEDLKKQLAQKEKQIKDSESRIAALEKSVNEQKSSTKTASAPAEPKPAPAKTASPTPASKPVPAKTAEISPQWELRSAQPGKAYVAIKGSNNVLVVENGDTLQGIGKIQSIAVENSLWVVRGTQGKIVQ